MFGVFVAFIGVVYGRMIYMSLPHCESIAVVTSFRDFVCVLAVL